MQEPQEMGVQSLSQEDPLEEEMATHSSILGQISLDRGAWQTTAYGITKSWTRQSTHTHTHTHTHKHSIGRMGSISEGESGPKDGMASFYGLGNFIG